MTDDEILVHKLELAITGQTVVHYDLDNPPLAPGTVAHRLGATRWRTDRHHYTIIFSIEPEDITRTDAGQRLSRWWESRLGDSLLKALKGA